MHVSMFPFYAGEIAGTVVGGLVIVGLIATFFILLFFTWVRCDTLRSRGGFKLGRQQLFTREWCQCRCMHGVTVAHK